MDDDGCEPTAEPKLTTALRSLFAEHHVAMPDDPIPLFCNLIAVVGDHLADALPAYHEQTAGSDAAAAEAARKEGIRSGMILKLNTEYESELITGALRTR